VILLLDTNILIDALCGRPACLTMLATATSAGHQLSVSVVNLAEVYAGMRPGEETRTRRFLSPFPFFPVTEATAERAGLLKFKWARKGKTLSIVDTIVAATALEHKLALVTANRKDFPMPELKFYPAT
jgi:predicted nucleic acid-binding protein